jgi:GTP-binding protein LepA
MNQSQIRNFAIIAHIDHGKSTLADRLLEMTGTVAVRDMSEQLLDSNPIERERGITIKLAPVRMLYRSSILDLGSSKENRNQLSEVSLTEPKTEDRRPKIEYILNLIDTPGHVDFSYEVSRSMAACEGAVLVVDATQGVQAQTLAHLNQARLTNLTIIPVLNKIDMPNARIEEVEAELVDLGFRQDEILHISAKTGQNVAEVLEAIITRIPPPKGATGAQLRALVFSSQYDPHRGVVVFVRVVDGELKLTPDTRLTFMASGAEVAPIDAGYFMPKLKTSPALNTGEVGYIATGLKDVRFAKVGDTITSMMDNRSSMSGLRSSENNHATLLPSHQDPRSKIEDPNHSVQPLPGYKEPKPMVFLGLFPVSSDEFTQAREAMEKLRLSDSAFTFRPISSMALGNGFHCGFLGLLHAEVVQERILREFDLTMLATTPSVEYLLKLKDGVNPGKAGLKNAAHQEKELLGYYSIQSATELPDPTLIEEVKEPVMQVTVYSPKRYVGPIMQLAQEKRGEYIDLVYTADQAQFTYLIPLSEMIIDFFDRLKSVTEGYASLDYEFFDYQRVDVAKVDILVNKEKVDALSFLVVKDQAHQRGSEITERLAQVIPRQQFNIPIQAAIGGKIVARADVKPFRKDVIQKLYGGDRTRKDKLLKKQKKGKAKMKMIGRVEIPQTAFFEVLRRE